MATPSSAPYNVAVRVDGRFNAAALGGWLACTLPAFVDMRAGRLNGFHAVVWWAAFLSFGAAYLRYLRSESSTRGTPADVVLVGVQAAAGLTMVWTAAGMTKYLSGVTLVTVAGQLPYVMSPRDTWIWVAAQTGALAAVFWIYFGWLGALSGGGAFAGFHVFFVRQALLERSERAARDALTRANAELRATHALLAENSRVAERLRISRDLHDTLGHHLTALSIQLEVASRKMDGAAAAHVREAHAITRLLLSDVRDVVSQLRGSGHLDLAAVIRSFAVHGGELRVHFDLPEALDVDDPTKAHAIFRCVQEILTNTTRHARASQIWIRIAPQVGGLDVHAHDDGQGAVAITRGNGLKGMRERFEELGGTVDFSTAPGRGFEVRAFMPLPGLAP